MKCPKCQHENPGDSVFCGKCATPLPTVGKPAISVTRTLETSVEELGRGTTFAGRYEIIEELGAGGMGRVYRAQDTKLNEEVALKLIKPEIAAERRVVERFRNEIKIARKITHKNVCRVHDLHEEGRTLYLTMEYVRGEDLRSLIHRTKALTIGAAVAIAQQVAEGLAEAHKLGIIHRDLKPGNIMIDKDGQAKIMDFGIARSLLGKGLTGEGAIIGTPEYMSPEQVEGKEADQRADIYALGVILFEMLVGCPPFEGETPFSIANKHKTEPPPVPKKLLPQIPEGLNKLVLRCLEKDKEKRYQTADELIADLSVIEQSLPSADGMLAGKRTQTRARTRIRTSREITVKLTPRKLAMPIAGIGLIVLALVLWRVVFPKKEPPAPPKIANSIAIASLKNLTGDPDPALDKLCRRGIPELLITSLEQGGHFRTATWQRMMDVLKQAGKKNVSEITDEDGFEICRRAGIKYLASSFLSKAGDTIVIDVKFLDAESKETFKSFQSKGRGVQSIFDSQIDDLNRKIAQGLGLAGEGIPTSASSIAEMTTSSPEAYQAYLEGVDAFNGWHIEEARSALERAVRLDPSFASAYRYLAATFMRFGDNLAAKKTIVEAERHSGRATDKEKFFIKAIKAESFGEFEKIPGFLPELEMLVARYPEDKDLHLFLGITLAEGANLFDRGIAEVRHVLELDPGHTFALLKIAKYCFHQGKFQEAIDYGKRYRALDPKSALPPQVLGSFYILLSRFTEAEASQKDALELDPGFIWPYIGLAYLEAMREDYPAAAAWLDRMFERSWPAIVESEALLFKGFLDLWRGRYERALSEFDRSAALADKADDKPLALLATVFRTAVLFDKGDTGKARGEIQILIDPAAGRPVKIPSWMRPELVYSLAMMDLDAGRPGDAQKRADELESFVPDPAELYWPGFDPELMKKKISRLQAFLQCEISLRLRRTTAEDIRRELDGMPGLPVSKTVSLSWPQHLEYFHFPPPFVEDTPARAYVAEEKFDEAIGAYEKIVKIPPESRGPILVHPRTHYRLAQLYDRANRKKDAAAEYRKFLDLWKDADPGRPEVEDARTRLSELTK